MVARAEPADAGDHRPRRPAAARRAERRRRRRIRHRSPGSPRSRPRPRSSSSSPSPARCSANHARSSTRSSSTSAANARSRSSRRASGTSATAAATPTCAPNSSAAPAKLTWHPAHMRHRYENWVEGLNGDWLVSRQRFFGVPVPVWYPLDAAGEPALRRAAPARRIAPADRPVDRRPCRVRGVPARPAGRLHRRPRHLRHLGDVVAHPADRRSLGGRGVRPVRARLPDGHASAGARHHPHLAVLDDGPQPSRVRRRPVVERRAVGLDPRPRPQEDVEVQGQRRHAARPVRDLRHRRRALLVRLRSSRRRHRVQRRPDEGRPQARHEAAQRHQVRADDRRGRRRCRAPMRSPTRSTCRCWPSSTRRSPRPPPGSRRSTTPVHSSGPRRSSGGSATTTSSWSRVAAYNSQGSDAAASARLALRDRAAHGPAPARPDHPVRRRGVVELVERRQHPRGAWPTHDRTGRRRCAARPDHRGPHPRAAFEDRGEGQPARRRRLVDGHALPTNFTR